MEEDTFYKQLFALIEQQDVSTPRRAVEIQEALLQVAVDFSSRRGVFDIFPRSLEFAGFSIVDAFNAQLKSEATQQQAMDLLLEHTNRQLEHMMVVPTADAGHQMMNNTPTPGRIYTNTLGRYRFVKWEHLSTRKFVAQLVEKESAAAGGLTTRGLDSSVLAELLWVRECTILREGDNYVLFLGPYEVGSPFAGVTNMGAVRLGSPRSELTCTIPGRSADVLGVQRFGMGWRVMAPGGRIVLDIDGGDEVAEAFEVELAEPMPTGEPPHDRRAQLDAELLEGGDAADDEVPPPDDKDPARWSVVTKKGE